MADKAAPHVVSLVLNRVEGDSRVIKTAKSAMNAGFDATIVGVNSVTAVETVCIEGVKVIRVPNFSKRLAQIGLWPDLNGRRSLDLLLEGNGRAMLDAIDLEGIDILHSHDMFGLKLGSMIQEEAAAGGRTLPWVHDLHEYVAGLETGADNDYRAAALRYERRYLHEADELLTVSRALAETVASRYHLEKVPEVVLNAPTVDHEPLSRRDIRNAVNVPNDAPLIVFVGVANELRGCDTIVDALTHLDGYHLAFVSQNAFAKDLKKKADAGPAAGRFHLHPYVPSDEVTSFLRTADLGIHGLVHYPNGEVALPNKLFEYMHAGLPIISSDVAAMKAFIQENDIGEIYVAGDARACADAVRRAYERKDSLRANITTELKAEYSWERQSRKIVESYQRLAAGDRPRLAREDQVIAIEKRDRATVAADVRLARAAAESSAYFIRSEINAAADAAVKNWIDARTAIVRKEGPRGLIRRLRAKLSQGRA